jgi:hypothetical protein
MLITPLQGQLTWSGDIAVTLKGLDRHLTTNANNRGDDPFNELRLRLFPRHWVNERMGFFGELLWDSGAQSDVKGAPRVNGAYVVINDILSQPWLSLKAGLIPSPFGNYGLRSTYFNLNPLIGIPLMWHHQTHISSSSYVTNQDLLGKKATDGGYTPIAYDACWDIGWEIFGELGIIEYSLALTEATLSSPRANRNDGRQMIVKLGLNPIMALRFGGSIARGPFLEPAAADSAHTRVEEFLATAIGFYAEYRAGLVHLLTEFAHSTWDEPLIEPDLELVASASYLEGRYDLLPALYLAARLDYFTYSEIDNQDTGRKESWGDPLNRVELGVGLRLSRESMVKCVYQYNDFETRSGADDPQVIALQYHMVF